MYTIIYSYLKIMYPGYLGRYTAVQNVLPTVYCTNIRKSWIPYCPYQNVHKMYLFFWASFIRWDQNGAMWNIDGQFNHPADQIVEKLKFLPLNCYLQDVWRWWPTVWAKEVDPLLWGSHCHHLLCRPLWLRSRPRWRWRDESVSYARMCGKFFNLFFLPVSHLQICI